MSRNHRQDDGDQDSREWQAPGPDPRDEPRHRRSTSPSTAPDPLPTRRRQAPDWSRCRRSKPTSPVTKAESPKLGSIVVLPPDTGGMNASSSPLAYRIRHRGRLAVAPDRRSLQPSSKRLPKTRTRHSQDVAHRLTFDLNSRGARKLAQMSKKAECDHERRVIGRQAGGSTRNPRRVSS